MTPRRSLAAAGLAVLLLVPEAAGTQATATREAVSAERLMAAVTALASPEMEGRAAGSAGGAKARAWILARFAALGLESFGEGFEQPFDLPPSTPAQPKATTGAEAGTRGVNLVGLCRGTDAGLPAIVLSAHYDHLGIRNGVLYPGADDNASGVAALLELARACTGQRFRHDLIVAAFDAEEGGLRGARTFVASPPVPRERLALNVNLDMVARGDRNELYLAGLTPYPALRPLVEGHAGRAPVRLRFGHDTPGTGVDDWTLQSDHGAFHAAGIPFLYFGVEDHPDYHQPSDTADRIDAAFFAAAAGTILDVLRTLDADLP